MQIDNGTRSIIELPGCEERICGVVAGFKTDEFIIIAANVPPYLRKKVSEPCVVTARYLHRGSVFGFKSRLLKYQLAPASLLFLAQPQKVECLELRKEPRVSCHFPARVSFKALNFKGLIVDISPSGCKLVVPMTGNVVDVREQIKGQLVQLDFFPLERSKSYSVFAKAVAVNREYNVLHFGLVFDDRHDQFKYMVADYVEACGLEKIAMDSM